LTYIEAAEEKGEGSGTEEKGEKREGCGKRRE
jgi:hypothetical protein